MKNKNDTLTNLQINQQKLLNEFYFFKARISFLCPQDLKLTKWWHVKFRGIVGKVLWEANQVLYDQMFKSKNQTPGLVVCPSESDKTFFKEGNRIFVYFNFVNTDDQLVKDFLDFLDDFPEFDFFGTNIQHTSLRICAVNNKFQPYKPIQLAYYKLGFDYIKSQRIEWEDFLWLDFLTPLTYRKNQILTTDINPSELLNRLYNRLIDLYKNYFSTTVTHDYKSFKPQVATLSNQLSFSGKIIVNRKDYTGVLGNLFIKIKYDAFLSHLLYLGTQLHIGNMANGGNGWFQAKPTRPAWIFDTFLMVIQSRMEPALPEEVIDQIASLNYIPDTLRKINIPKSDGDFRTLEIPGNEDAQLQKALAEVLTDYFDPKFLPQSFAYRKGKSAKQAILQIQRWKKEFPKATIIRCDIDNFFDSIPFHSLMSKLYYLTQDFKLCHLIELWVRSHIKDGNRIARNPAGLPQGSPLSPVLSNMYLHQLDAFIAREISPHFIRYADDIFILLTKGQAPLEMLIQLKKYISAKLALKLNEEYRVAPMGDSITFLGITLWGKNQLSVSEKKIWSIAAKIKNYLNFHNGQEKITDYLKSLKRYYGQLLGPEEIRKIDYAIYQIYVEFAVRSNAKNQKINRDWFKKNGLIDRANSEKFNWELLGQKSASQIVKSIEKKLEIQHKKSIKASAPEFELVISKPGSFLGKNKNKIRISFKGKTLKQVPFKQLRHICIMAPGVGLSSSVSRACATKGIAISFFDRVGKCYMIQQGQPNESTEVVKLQLNISENQKQEVAAKIVVNKIKNQVKLLKYYYKYYKNRLDLTEEMDGVIKKMAAIIKELNASHNKADREELFLTEARAAAYYWKGFGILVRHFGFEYLRREKKGAQDLVNQMLNYAYAILQNRVTRALMAEKLSLSLGVLHSQSHKESLVFDMMEQYRAFIADRAVLAILSKHKKPEKTEKGDLALEVRKSIIEKINLYYATPIKYRGASRSLNDVMYLLAGNYVDFLKGKDQKLKLYNAKW